MTQGGSLLAVLESGCADPDLEEEISQFAHSEPILPASRLSMLLAEQWMAGQAVQWWLEDYRYLRSQGWKWKDALCVVWLSLRKDDRGDVGTVEALTDWLGVSRRWYYSRRGKFDGQPGPGQNLWDVMAEQLQIRRLRGARLAEVDEVTYEKAVDRKGTTWRDRELYYKRAGALQEESRVQIVGDGGGPVDFVDVTDDELKAIRAALETEAAGGGAT